MNVELTPEQVEVLRSLIVRERGDLFLELRHTDDTDVRAALERRKQVVDELAALFGVSDEPEVELTDADLHKGLW